MKLTRKAGVTGLLVVASLLLVAVARMAWIQDEVTAEAPATSAAAVDRRLQILASHEIRGLQLELRRAAAMADIELDLAFAPVSELARLADVPGGPDVVLSAAGEHTRLMLGSAALSSTPVFRTSVVVVVSPGKARELGWVGSTPTWLNVARAMRDGRVRLGLGSPAWSASGLAAVLSASLPSKEAVDDVDGGRAVIDFSGGSMIVQGATLVGSDDGWLVEQYRREDAVLDGVVLSESEAVRLNESLAQTQRNVLVYPAGGSVGLDVSLLGVNGAKREVLAALTQALLSPSMQATVSAGYYLRPVVEGVQEHPALPGHRSRVLDLRINRNAVRLVPELALTQWRRPSTTYLVVPATAGDAEGSVAATLSILDPAGQRLAAGLTERAAAIQDGERVVAVTYGESPVVKDAEVGAQAALSGSLPGERPARQAGGPRARVSLLAAVLEAQRLAAAEIGAHPQRSVQVLAVIADENTAAPVVYDFQQSQKGLGVRVFALLLKGSNPVEGLAIGGASGGRVFDARHAPALAQKLLAEARAHL